MSGYIRAIASGGDGDRGVELRFIGSSVWSNVSDGYSNPASLYYDGPESSLLVYARVGGGAERIVNVTVNVTQDIWEQYSGLDAYVDWTTGGIDADIYLDGSLIASNSRAGSTTVEAGNHTFEFRKDGYSTFTLTQYCPSGVLTTFSHTLEEEGGYLTVISTPSGAVVEVTR